MVAPFAGNGFASAASGGLNDYQRWLRRRQAEAAAGTLGAPAATAPTGFSLQQSAPEALSGGQAGPRWANMSLQEAAPPTATPSIQAPVQLPQTATAPAGLPSVQQGFANANAMTSNALAGQQAGGTLDAGWNSNMLGAKAGQTWDGRQWVGPGQFRAAGSDLGVGGVKLTVAYDPNRDTLGQDMSTHVGGDTNWMKVNRWMADGVREHGMTPQAAYDAALARLKRDYELNGQDWGRSGFDLRNVQSAAPGQDFGAAGTTAAKAVGATGGAAGAGATGGAPTINDGLTDPVRKRLVNESDAAFRYLAQQRGFNPDSGGFATSYLRKYYMPDIQGLQQMAGYANSGAGNDTAEIAGLLNNLGNAMFARNGAGVNDYVRGVARHAVQNAQGYLNNAPDEAAMAFLENANYLQNRGSALAESAAQQRFKQWQGQYSDVVNQTLGGDASQPQTFAEFMRRRGYGIADPFR